MRITVPNIPKPVVYAVGFIPAAYISWRALSGGEVDAIPYFEHGLGQWALRFLIATLCITPLRQIFSVAFNIQPV